MHVRLRHGAFIALPMVASAVSLADMTPRATGLSPVCNQIYTSQIYGCTSTDFQSQQCSSSCISALNGIAIGIQHACGGQGITGENLVVAFLAGVGPEQICHNAGSDGGSTTMQATTSQHSTTKLQPTIVSSTTTAHKATQTKSLIIDTSSSETQTIVPHKTHKTQKTQQTSHTTSEHPSSSTTLIMASSTTQKAAGEHTAKTQTTQTTSATGSSQTNLEDHSGGGSPFDTEGNMNSAGRIPLSLGSTVLTAAAAAAAAVFALAR